MHLCVGAHARPLDHRGGCRTPTAQHQGGWHPDERALPGQAAEVAGKLVARGDLGAGGGCHAGDARIALQSARPGTRVGVADDHPAVDGGTGQPRDADVELRGTTRWRSERGARCASTLRRRTARPGRRAQHRGAYTGSDTDDRHTECADDPASVTPPPRLFEEDLGRWWRVVVGGRLMGRGPDEGHRRASPGRGKPTRTSLEAKPSSARKVNAAWSAPAKPVAPRHVS